MGIRTGTYFARLVCAIAGLALSAPRVGAQSEYPDEPVAYYFDLTGKGKAKGKPTFLVLKAPVKVWQHGDHPPGWPGGMSVRKGWGAAFWYIDDPQAPGTAAHALIEIEPLGKRKLKAAVSEVIEGWEGRCAVAKQTLRTAPGKPRRIRHKLGRKRVQAYSFEYTVSPPAIHGSAVFRGSAIVFALNGQLVTVSVENMGGNDFTAVFTGRLSVAGKRDDREHPFKLFHIDGGVSRFFTLPVPPGFIRNHDATDGMHSALWERRDSSGKVVARLTVTERWAHKRPLSEVMLKRAAAARSRYEAFSGPDEVAVSGRPAWRVTYREKTDSGTRDVRQVYIRLANQDYAVTWETLGGDPARVDADRAILDKLVGRARVWRSRAD